VLPKVKKKLTLSKKTQKEGCGTRAARCGTPLTLAPLLGRRSTPPPSAAALPRRRRGCGASGAWGVGVEVQGESWG